jgi:predicted dehydrogenase
MTAKKVRIGLLGVAHTHAEAYARSLVDSVPSAELVAVYDRDAPYGRDFAKRHGTLFKKNIDGLLSEVDAVIIASENVFHHSLAVRAARAGKHILCEKPIAVSLKDAEEVRREARKSGVKFQMCYVMRYHTVASVVKELIDEGRIGDILALVGVNKLNSSMTSKGWFSDKRLSGGGAVMDHTVHLADMMRWYTGSEAKEVYCEIAKNINPRLSVEDAFLTTVTFENGVLGHIDGSWSYPAGYQTWGDVTLEVLGTKGMLFLDAFRQNIYFTGENRPDDRLTWHNYGCDPNTEMIKSFVDSILNDDEPLASADDGIRGLQITLAGYESHRRGRPVTPSSL